MFGLGQFKILISKYFLLFVAVLACAILAPFELNYVNKAHAQEQNDPNEYILQVLLPPDWLISEAIFAYELNGKYYLPLRELSDGFEFYSEVETEAKFAQGFASQQENSFTLDGSRNEIIVKGVKESLNEDVILVSDFVATDDLYVQIEVLNKIWPVDMTLELSNLTVNTEASEDLSFMRNKERRDARQKAISRKEQREKEKELLPRRDNDYQLLGKPVIDYQSTYTFDDQTDDLTGSNTFTGLVNIAKLQADFSTNFRFDRDEGFEKPDNVRLSFSRMSAGNEYLLPGIRRVEFGDVIATQRDLIANSSTGRGFTVSNDNRSRDDEFDRITIEGIGPPGWEIELYNNNELIDFGEVPTDGLYFFEDVILGFGNNEIKILFFGPQGQVREENRSYTAGGGMLKPGEFKYAATILDADRSLILLDNEPRSEPRGAVTTLNASYGVNKAVTVFANYTGMPTQASGNVVAQEQDRDYVTVGSSLTSPVGLFKAEAYSEIEGGNAFSLDYITKFLGFRLNTTASLFNDFESEDAGFNNNKKTSEIETQLTRNVKLFSVPLGLRFNALRTKRETNITTTDLEATQTFTRAGIRVSNSTRTRLNEDAHERTTGSLTSTVREGPWQFRGSLNYSLYPNSEVSSANGEIRYRTEDSFQTALNLSHNFQSSDYRVGLQAGYDFKRFLGTAESSYERGKGWSFVLRTSTSLNPYTEDERYTFDSRSKRNSAPIKAYVFLDENLDGEMNEGEEPLEGVKIKYAGGRSKNATDETGYVIADLPTDRITNVLLDTGSIIDPYFMPAYEGFSAVPIKGKMMEATFPVIETGSIEGTTYRQSNDKVVAGLMVSLVNEEGESIMSVETGFDGFYVFEFVPPGTYTVQTAERHVVELVENTVTVAPGDLYVYGHDVYINDVDIAVIEEQYMNVEPAAGEDALGPPREQYGPPLPHLSESSGEMAGTLGADGLISGLDKLPVEQVKVPAVTPRKHSIAGQSGLYALQ